MAFCKNCGKEIKDGEKCSCEKESKFCKNCGKKLKGNETCDCEGAKKVATASSGSFDFAATMKDIKDDLLNVWKKPVDVVKENTDANNFPKTICVLVIVALSFGIFISSIFKYLYSLIADFVLVSGSVNISDFVDLPYVKIAFFGMILWILSTLGYVLAILAVQAIFKNKKLNFKEALTLTVSSHYPLVWANVICAVIALLNLSAIIIFLPWLIVNIIVMYNFAHSYSVYTNVNDNKFGYVLTVLVCIAAIIGGICSAVVSPSMGRSIGEDIVDSIDIDDMDFGW